MYYCINTVSFLLSRLSLRNLDRLAHLLSFVLFKIFRIRRKLILKNLDIAFANEKSQEEKNKIAESCFYHFVLTVLEFLYFRKGDIAQNMRIENPEEIRRVLEEGRGAYVIAMHMSNWEASASGVSKQIKAVNAVVKKIGSPGINRFITELREANGMHIIFRKSTGDAVRSMRNFLKKGEIVAVILDQARPGEPYLPFFGKEAKTNTSFAAIAARIKAPIFLAYSVRDSVGVHRLRFKEQVYLQETDDAQRDVLVNSTHLNKEIEMCIREYPEQYFWLHDRWKKSRSE